RCPCKFCKNEKDYSSSRTIYSHLFNSGFMPNYYVWTKHGERGIVLDNNVEEEDRIPDFAANYNSFFNDTAMGEPEEDTEGYVVEDDLGQMLREAKEGCETENESRDLMRMLEDYRTLLYLASAWQPLWYRLDFPTGTNGCLRLRVKYPVS